MKTIIVGGGEIGKSLLSVLEKHYPCKIIDVAVDENIQEYEIMHVCFPYSGKFVDYVKEYQEKYKPKYTVCHSSVPVGTSEKINAVSSPCMGIHPHLGESFKTFIKFLGGKDADNVADYFRRAGLKVYQTDKQETTELMKISSTTFYGVCIEYVKELKNECDKNSIPFEMWTLWTENYNKGYKELRHEEYMRPNLIPTKGKIGGHCVVSNTSFINNKFTKLIKDANK